MATVAQRAGTGTGRSHRAVVLVLSTADWDAPLWTNKQHLAHRLASRGVEVTYVDSIGLRRPALTVHDLRRVVRRLARVRSKARARPRPPDVSVRRVSPLLVPWHGGPQPVLGWNAHRLRQAVGTWLRSPPQCRVLWTFSPVTYGLEEEAVATVYHCVDFLGDLPGVDPVVIERGERLLAQSADVAVASSGPIAVHLRATGFDRVELWENVADTRLVSALSQAVDRRPAAVFAGNLTPDKVDFGLLERLLDELPELVLHVAGPMGVDGTRPVGVRDLLEHPRVRYHGVLPPERLAALLGSVTVGLIPYRINPYTRGVFPLKVHEYLAAGLAVVATPLPALRPCEHVHVGLGADFVTAVREQLHVPTPDVLGARRSLAAANSWERRTDEAVELLRELAPSCEIG